MIDTLFALVISYGVVVIFASTFLSCLAVPVPTSLMMLAAGALVAAGDLVLWQVVSSAFVGAVAGDQTGYHLSRKGGAPIIDRLARHPKRRKLVDRARASIEKHGPLGVFFSRWLFSPLGPWVNFIAGTARLHYGRFTLWAILGEAVWVTVYIGLGYGFAANLALVAELSSDVVGILMALGLAGAMIFWLRQALVHHREMKRAAALSEETGGNI